MIVRPASQWSRLTRFLPFGVAAVVCLVIQTAASAEKRWAQNQAAAPGITRAAAATCDAKVKRMEAYADNPGKAGALETKLSEAELNSYLAVDLSPSFHPCLKSIVLKFQEGHLQAVASIDFDRLQLNSTQLVSGLIRKMLTGVHTLTVAGKLISDAGKASFSLDQAQFDSITLPNILVSEIISAVGRKQNPPFDPMQPTELPFHIQRVDVHTGYLLIVQRPGKSQGNASSAAVTLSNVL